MIISDEKFARAVFKEALHEFLIDEHGHEMSEIEKLSDLDLYRSILNYTKCIFNLEKIEYMCRYCPKAAKRYSLEYYRWTPQDTQEVLDWIYSWDFDNIEKWRKRK